MSKRICKYKIRLIRAFSRNSRVLISSSSSSKGGGGGGETVNKQAAPDLTPLRISFVEKQRSSLIGLNKRSSSVIIGLMWMFRKYNGVIFLLRFGITILLPLLVKGGPRTRTSETLTCTESPRIWLVADSLISEELPSANTTAMERSTDRCFSKGLQYGFLQKRVNRFLKYRQSFCDAPSVVKSHRSVDREGYVDGSVSKVAVWVFAKSEIPIDVWPSSANVYIYNAFTNSL